MVCKLNKAIYGLKQGARRWILTLKAGLKRMGLKCSESDQGVFVIRRGEAELIMLTYVDDIMMADNCETLVGSTQKARAKSAPRREGTL